jgi:predicted RNase H-like HicB family nuclease
MIASILIATPGKLMLNILLEQDEKGKLVATVLEVPNCQAEGGTRQQALDRVKQILADRLSHAEIIPIEVTPASPENSWMKFAGIFNDDPLFAEIAQEIRAEREDPQ